MTPNAVMLDAHAESYATAGDVRVTADRSADPDVAVVEFTWRVAYMGSDLSLLEPRPALLMLALPHHVDVLVADDTVGFLAPSSLAYRAGPHEPCFNCTSTLECLSDHKGVKKEASTFRDLEER